MGRKKDPNEPKKTFWDRYKTYNTETEGFGSEEQWRNAFKERIASEGVKSGFLGTKKRKIGRHQRTARDIIGVGVDATWKEIQSAYRKGVFKNHPDHGGSQEEFIDFQEAYEVLKSEFGK